MRRLLREQHWADVDFPTWLIESLDREAERLGVTPQSPIKIWIAERLEQRAGYAATRRSAGAGHAVEAVPLWAAHG